MTSCSLIHVGIKDDSLLKGLSSCPLTSLHIDGVRLDPSLRYNKSFNLKQYCPHVNSLSLGGAEGLKPFLQGLGPQVTDLAADFVLPELAAAPLATCTQVTRLAADMNSGLDDEMVSALVSLRFRLDDLEASHAGSTSCVWKELDLWGKMPWTCSTPHLLRLPLAGLALLKLLVLDIPITPDTAAVSTHMQQLNSTLAQLPDVQWKFGGPFYNLCFTRGGAAASQQGGLDEAVHSVLSQLPAPELQPNTSLTSISSSAASSSPAASTAKAVVSIHREVLPTFGQAELQALGSSALGAAVGTLGLEVAALDASFWPALCTALPALHTLELQTWDPTDDRRVEAMRALAEGAARPLKIRVREGSCGSSTAVAEAGWGKQEGGRWGVVKEFAWPVNRYHMPSRP